MVRIFTRHSCLVGTFGFFPKLTTGYIGPKSALVGNLSHLGTSSCVDNMTGRLCFVSRQSAL